MEFTLTINCDNDAFSQDVFYEVCRILTAEAAKMKRWVGNDTSGWSSTLVDFNGTKVGVAKFVDAQSISQQ